MAELCGGATGFACDQDENVDLPFRRLTLHFDSLGAAHVIAGARVDLDRLPFVDEKGNVHGLAGLEDSRLGHVARGIAAQTLQATPSPLN